jgi:peroxin-7
VFSPSCAFLFASASGDQTVKLWDTRKNHSSLSIFAHASEVLALDWNKYDPNVLVSGSVDKSCKVWDIRQPQKPLQVLLGHEFAIRRLKCSPHTRNLIATASYDTTLRFWDWPSGQLLKLAHHHSEFCFGIDFSLFTPGKVVSCGWDDHSVVFDVSELIK